MGLKAAPSWKGPDARQDSRWCRPGQVRATNPGTGCYIPDVRNLGFLASALLLIAGVSARATIATAAAPPEPLRVPVTIETDEGPQTFQAEIADTPRLRARGLMFRSELGDRQGMLFVFPAEDHLSFWMKNTLIPLDMVFIRADRTVLGVVKNAEPKTLTSRRVGGKSQYLLELAGGDVERYGIRRGQRVRFMVPAAER